MSVRDAIDAASAPNPETRVAAPRDSSAHRLLASLGLAKVPRQIRWSPSGEFGLTPPLPASVRAGSNLNKFAGEIMTALAGVGSKLEAMQERLERNEAGVETMAEQLKSAVESLRTVEAAAATTAATTTTTTLATPAPVAPDPPSHRTPPSRRPPCPHRRRRRPRGRGAGGASRRAPVARVGSTRVGSTRDGPRRELPVRAARDAPTGTPARAPARVPAAAASTAPGRAAPRASTAARRAAAAGSPRLPPPPSTAAAAAFRLPARAAAAAARWIRGISPRRRAGVPPAADSEPDAAAGWTRAARQPERQGERRALHRRFRQHGVHQGPGAGGDSRAQRQRADGGHQRGARQAHEQQAVIVTGGSPKRCA